MFLSLFSVFLENRAILGFRAESQDEERIDVIGYLTKTSNVVVGEKCGRLC